MAKTGASGQLTMQSALTIIGDLEFTGTGNNKILLGTYDLNMSSASAIVTATTDHPTNGWVATNSTGEFVKATSAGDVVKNMEIGSATAYTPVQLNMTGTGGGDVSALTRSTGLNAKYSEADAYIDREWKVSITTPTITSTTLTGTYVAGDVTGTASLIYGCTYDSGEWDFTGTGQAANTVIASTSNTAEVLSGQNFFGKVDVKAFLQGAFSAAAMTTTLNTSGLIPTTSPYADAPATVGSIPAGVTDWVKLELRDPANPGTPTTNKASAFIKSDGSVVGLDGTSVPRVKNGYTTSVVVLSHRNHLSIRTPDAGLDVVNPTLHDFTTGLGQAFTSSNSYPNANMKDMGSGAFAMWGGDVNGNGNVKFAGPGNDNNVLLNTILGGNKSLVINNAYSDGDLNMDGVVKYSGPANDRNVLLNSVLGGNKSIVFNSHLN